jgi:hypothetical protein
MFVIPAGYRFQIWAATGDQQNTGITFWYAVLDQ